MNGEYRPGGKDYIYVNDDRLLKIDDYYIQKLKDKARTSNFKRLTMCLHNDVREHVHEMIHVYKKHEYVRPHHHPEKTETKIILEGKLLVVIYNAEGVILDRFVMSKEQGSIFTFRMDRGIIHTNIPLTDVVFQEIITGPFTGRGDSVFPDWAPTMEDEEGITGFMDRLLKDVDVNC